MFAAKAKNLGLTFLLERDNPGVLQCDTRTKWTDQAKQLPLHQNPTQSLRIWQESVLGFYSQWVVTGSSRPRLGWFYNLLRRKESITSGWSSRNGSGAGSGWGGGVHKPRVCLVWEIKEVSIKVLQGRGDLWNIHPCLPGYLWQKTKNETLFTPRTHRMERKNQFPQTVLPPPYAGPGTCICTYKHARTWTCTRAHGYT